MCGVVPSVCSSKSSAINLPRIETSAMGSSPARRRLSPVCKMCYASSANSHIFDASAAKHSLLVCKSSANYAALALRHFTLEVPSARY